MEKHEMLGTPEAVVGGMEGEPGQTVSCDRIAVH